MQTNVLTESKRYSQAISFYTQVFEKAPMVKIIGDKEVTSFDDSPIQTPYYIRKAYLKNYFIL